MLVCMVYTYECMHACMCVCVMCVCYCVGAYGIQISLHVCMCASCMHIAYYLISLTLDHSAPVSDSLSLSEHFWC